MDAADLTPVPESFLEVNTKPALAPAFEARRLEMTTLIKELIEQPPLHSGVKGALPIWELGVSGAWPRRTHVEGTSSEGSTQI